MAIKTLFLNWLILINFIGINAQEHKPRNEKHPIQLSDKQFIYQLYTDIKDKDIAIWKLFLKKEGETKIKLEEITIEKNTVEAGVPPFISKNMARIMNQDIIMLIPKLIDAYKEEQRIYVFLYKNRSATLQIYNFEDGTNFKKHEYSLAPIRFGSVANFGGYRMEVLKKRDKKNVFHVVTGRESGGSERKSFKIKKNNVYELKKFRKIKLKKVNLR